MNYKEQLNDPRWKSQAKRIKQRDVICQICGEGNNLQVHHLYYDFEKKPWEYEDDYLITLCKECHKMETTANIMLSD